MQIYYLKSYSLFPEEYKSKYPLGSLFTVIDKNTIQMLKDKFIINLSFNIYSIENSLYSSFYLNTIQDQINNIEVSLKKYFLYLTKLNIIKHFYMFFKDHYIVSKDSDNLLYCIFETEQEVMEFFNIATFHVSIVSVEKFDLNFNINLIEFSIECCLSQISILNYSYQEYHNVFY